MCVKNSPASNSHLIGFLTIGLDKIKTISCLRMNVIIPNPSSNFLEIRI